MPGTDPESLIHATADGRALCDDGQPVAPTYAELLALVTHLRAAMESRPVIDQAKGILIAVVGCDAERAFRLLVAQSQHENRKVRDVAAELVARYNRRQASNGDDGRSGPPTRVANRRSAPIPPGGGPGAR